MLNELVYYSSRVPVYPKYMIQRGNGDCYNLQDIISLLPQYSAYVGADKGVTLDAEYDTLHLSKSTV